MKSKQINKKEPYYATGNNQNAMPPEQTLQKARNEKYLKAFNHTDESKHKKKNFHLKTKSH